VINEIPFSSKAYLRKPKKEHQVIPYPNPIKLMSRDQKKDIKGDYLKAEMMNQGVALPISDIRPKTDISSDIFPRQLTQGAIDEKKKDIFTPPSMNQHQEEGLFLTEANIGSMPIREEEEEPYN
jgi:hypothetical protein